MSWQLHQNQPKQQLKKPLLPERNQEPLRKNRVLPNLPHQDLPKEMMIKTGTPLRRTKIVSMKMMATMKEAMIVSRKIVTTTIVMIIVAEMTAMRHATKTMMEMDNLMVMDGPPGLMNTGEMPTIKVCSMQKIA